MEQAQLSQFRKNAFLLLVGVSSTFYVGTANANGSSPENQTKLEEVMNSGRLEVMNNALKMKELSERVERFDKEIKVANNMRFQAMRESTPESILTVKRLDAELEDWKTQKASANEAMQAFMKEQREHQQQQRKALSEKFMQERAAAAANTVPNENAATAREKTAARTGIPTASDNSTAANGANHVGRPIKRFAEKDLEYMTGVKWGAGKPGGGENPETGNAFAGNKPGPRANTSSSAASQGGGCLGELLAKRAAAVAAAGGGVPPLPSYKRAETSAPEAPAAAAPAAVGPALANQHVILGAHDSLTVAPGPAPAPQASLILTNQAGNTHGVLVAEDKLVLSGGLHSTNLRLDDDGATFSETSTGAAVVVGGVADGVAPNDAANVGQLRTVVDAAVTPLGARLDGLESRVQQLDQKINAVEKKLSGGVAMALALSQPVSFAPKSCSAVTGGVATYNGQTALGFSFNRLLSNTETRRTVVSMGVAATTSGRSSASARAGASFSW